MTGSELEPHDHGAYPYSARQIIGRQWILLYNTGAELNCRQYLPEDVVFERFEKVKEQYGDDCCVICRTIVAEESFVRWHVKGNGPTRSTT